MEIAVNLPQQERIDFNETCYAFMVIGVTRYSIIQVGRSVEEARENAVASRAYSKNTYSDKRFRYMRQATPEGPVPDKFHRGIYYQIVECDMKFYLQFKEVGLKEKSSVKFIFDRTIPPIRIKYAR